jgi:hypothetical protein
MASRQQKSHFWVETDVILLNFVDTAIVILTCEGFYSISDSDEVQVIFGSARSAVCRTRNNVSLEKLLSQSVHFITHLGRLYEDEFSSLKPRLVD